MPSHCWHDWVFVENSVLKELQYMRNPHIYCISAMLHHLVKMSNYNVLRSPSHSVCLDTMLNDIPFYGEGRTETYGVPF